MTDKDMLETIDKMGRVCFERGIRRVRVELLDLGVLELEMAFAVNPQAEARRTAPAPAPPTVPVQAHDDMRDAMGGQRPVLRRQPQGGKTNG